MLDITCVILNYNDADTVIKLIENIKDYDVIDHILVVDNHSTDNSYKILSQRYTDESKIIVKITDKNGGYGYGNNFGIKYAYYNLKSKYVIVANPDVFFTDKMVQELLNVITAKKAALVSGVQRIEENQIYDLAWKVPTALQWTFSESKLGSYFKKIYHYNSDDLKEPVLRVECVPGAMFLIDAAKFISVGGYDEDVFLFGEETMLGFKLKKANYDTYLLTNEFYEHEHSTTINKNIQSVIKQIKILHNSKMIFFTKYLKSPKYVLRLYSLFFSLRTTELKVKFRLKGK